MDPTGGGEAMNEIYKLIREVLIAGFAGQGMTVRVMQSYSGVSTGPPAVPAIIMHHITSERVGWQSRKPGVTSGKPEIIEHQNVAETIQFNAVMPFVKPEDETVDTPTVQWCADNRVADSSKSFDAHRAKSRGHGYAGSEAHNLQLHSERGRAVGERPELRSDHLSQTHTNP